MQIDQLVTDYYLQLHQHHLCQIMQLLLCWSSTLDHCRSLLPVHHRPLISLFYTSFSDYNKCIFRISLGSACLAPVIPLVSFLTLQELNSHEFFHHVRSLRSADWSLRCSVICRFRLSSRWKSSVKNANINHSCPWASIQHQTHQLMGGKRPYPCLMRRHTDCRGWYLSISLCTEFNKTSSATRSMMLLQHLQPSAMRGNLPTNRHSE